MPTLLASPPMALALIMLGLLLLGTTTLRPGHHWGGDFAQYVAHAINIVDGRPYDDIGYIFNPRAKIGPRSYPPLTPLILAPIYAWLGLDLEAMKAVLYVFFVASLAFVYLTLRRLTGDWGALGLTVAFALSPYVWDFRNTIFAEFSFLFFFYLAMWLVCAPAARGLSAQHSAKIALQVGAIFLASASRSVGTVLLLTMFLRDILHERRVSQETLVTIAGFAALWLAQRTIMGTGAGYGELFADFGIASLAYNLAVYPYMCWMFFLGFGPELGMATKVTVALVFVAVVMIGFLAKVLGALENGRPRLSIRHFGFFEILVICYFLMIVFPPFTQAPRYMMPILPLLLWYAYRGGSLLLSPAIGSVRVRVGVLLAVVAATYAWGYTRIEYGEITNGPTTPESVEMFAYIQEGLPEDAVVLFAKPRVMALFGERQSAIWSDDASEREAWCYFAEIGATHLVTTKSGADLEVPGFLEVDVLDQSANLKRLYSNPHFVAYEILDLPDCGES